VTWEFRNKFNSRLCQPLNVTVLLTIVPPLVLLLLEAQSSVLASGLKLAIIAVSNKEMLRQYFKGGHNSFLVHLLYAPASYSGGPGFKPRPVDRLP
jgi:hypothetical protein